MFARLLPSCPALSPLHPTQLGAVSVAWLAVALALAGCGGARGSTASTTEGDGDATAGAPGWPTVLISRAGDGPALYAGPDADAPAFGYLSEGVRLRLDSAPTNGRVLVTVGGSVVVHGWVPLSRMMAYTTTRGRLDGTPIFIGAGDPIGLVARGTGDAVEVELNARLGREGAADIGPFTGTIPLSWLVDRPAVESDDGLDAGTPMLLPAGAEVGLYDRPNGSVIVTLPVLDPPLTVVSLRDRSGWHGVRIGVGPFLVGYVHADLEPSTVEAIGTRPGLPSVAAVDGTPARVAMEEDGTLVRVDSGTRIRFYGEEVARLRAEGWARELGRDGEEVDAFVAVDNGVAVRGIVPSGSVTAVPVDGD